MPVHFLDLNTELSIQVQAWISSNIFEQSFFFAEPGQRGREGGIFHAMKEALCSGSAARSMILSCMATLALSLPTDDRRPRVATGNGALTLDFSPPAITAVHLGSVDLGPADSATTVAAGGFALREFPSGRTYSAYSEGSATIIPGLSPASPTVSLTSVVRPLGWQTDAVTTASFTSHEDHIRVEGSVALSHTEPCPYPAPCPNGSAPADRAVSLQLGFPLPQVQGWRLWSDAESFITLPTANASTQHVFGGQSKGVGALPFTVDRYPMLALTSPDGSRGAMLAVPMESTLYIYRISYDTLTGLLSITFDFGLTSHSRRFPSMASFACLLFPLTQPHWGFRAALQQFYVRYPSVWISEQAVIRRQGTWVACVPDISSLPGWQDFGIAFAEESTGYNVSQSRWMNEHGIGIFPYIEPGLIHWRLPKGNARPAPHR